MATRTTRGRQALQNGTFRNIQISANTIFKPTGRPNLLPLVRRAVDLNNKIVVEGQMLATLHTLRMVQMNIALPTLTTGNKNETAWRSMVEQCYAAVSQATGPQCKQFSPTSHPDLASSLAVYNQCLPAGHSRPTRPTWLKPVSLICLSQCVCHPNLTLIQEVLQMFDTK